MFIKIAKPVYNIYCILLIKLLRNSRLRVFPVNYYIFFIFKRVQLLNSNTQVTFMCSYTLQKL